MAGENVNISDQFKGLPIGDLIGGPLVAACDAQVKLAEATSNFIRTVGFLQNGNGSNDGETRQVSFKFKRPTAAPEGGGGAGESYEEEVELDVPLLAIVRVPNLAITTVDVTFDMEVKSSFKSSESDDKSGKLKAEGSFGIGAFKGSLSIEGSISTHKENTRSSDNSAKYHINVHAEDKGMPEGLSRVMDILQTACAPRRVSPPKPVPPLEYVEEAPKKAAPAPAVAAA